MALVTLSELRTRVRERADMVYSQFVSDSELRSYINASARKLYDLLVEAGEDYYSASLTFTLATGEASYTLPANTVYKLRGLDIQEGGAWLPVGSYQQLERGHWQQNSIDRLIAKVKYRLFSDTLEFLPADQTAGTYRLRYVPFMTAMVSDSDTFNGYNGYEEYIVVDAAIKCKDKEESSTTVLEREKLELERKISAVSGERDYAAPDRVEDVRSGSFGSYYL